MPKAVRGYLVPKTASQPLCYSAFPPGKPSADKSKQHVLPLPEISQPGAQGQHPGWHRAKPIHSVRSRVRSPELRNHSSQKHTRSSNVRRTSTFNIPFRCQLHNPAILVETSQFFNRIFLFLSFLEQMARFLSQTASMRKLSFPPLVGGMASGDCTTAVVHAFSLYPLPSVGPATFRSDLGGHVGPASALSGWLPAAQPRVQVYRWPWAADLCGVTLVPTGLVLNTAVLPLFHAWPHNTHGTCQALPAPGAHRGPHTRQGPLLQQISHDSVGSPRTPLLPRLRLRETADNSLG